MGDRREWRAETEESGERRQKRGESGDRRERRAETEDIGDRRERQGQTEESRYIRVGRQKRADT